MATKNITPTRLYSVPRVAEILGVNPATVRAFIRARKLATRRPRQNSHPRIPGASLIEFLGLTVPSHGCGENN